MDKIKPKTVIKENEEYILENKDYLLIETLRDLAVQINRLTNRLTNR